MRQIGTTLVSIKELITAAIATAAETTQNGHTAEPSGQNAVLTQNIPWPQPLEVDSGDIYDNYNLFKENWAAYTSATGIDSWGPDHEKRKINILLTVVGDKAKRKYCNFSLKDTDKTTAENVLKVMDECLISERKVLYDRYLFHSCNQEEGESFHSYYLRLKKSWKYVGMNKT